MEENETSMTADEIEKGINYWTATLKAMRRRNDRLRMRNRVTLILCVLACLIQVTFTHNYPVVWNIIFYGIQIPACTVIIITAVQLHKFYQHFEKVKHDFLAFMKRANAADPYQRAVLILRK